MHTHTHTYTHRWYTSAEVKITSPVMIESVSLFVFIWWSLRLKTPHRLNCKPCYHGGDVTIGSHHRRTALCCRQITGSWKVKLNAIGTISTLSHILSPPVDKWSYPVIAITPMTRWSLPYYLTLMFVPILKTVFVQWNPAKSQGWGRCWLIVKCWFHCGVVWIRWLLRSEDLLYCLWVWVCVYSSVSLMRSVIWGKGESIEGRRVNTVGTNSLLLSVWPQLCPSFFSILCLFSFHVFEHFEE